MACTNLYTGSSTTLPTASGGTVTPQLGDVISCTITNTRLASNATLSLSKTSQVVSDPYNGTTKTIRKASISTSNSIQAGRLTASTNGVNAGRYFIGAKITDADGHTRSIEQVKFKQKILVPFAPETPASGIEETGFFQACWYRRTFATPRLGPNDRLILHFGAVDYIAAVWVNGQLATRHEGGYTPFHADVTDLHRARLALVVAARLVLANGLGLLGVSAPERI